MHCFIHIPSTGGTTVWSMLGDGSGGRVQRIRCHSLVENEHRVAALIAERAGDFAVIGGHARYGFYEPATPHVAYFTFLRDPVDRVLSTYFRRIRNGKHVPASTAAYRNWEDFISFARPHRRQVLNFLLGRPRAEELEQLGVQEQLRAAIQHVAANYVFIGILEEFDTSVYYLARELRWPQVPRYDVRNRGGNKRLVPDEVRRELEGVFAVEVELCRHFREVLLGRKHRDAVAARMACTLHGWRGAAWRGLSAAFVPGYRNRYLKG